MVSTRSQTGTKIKPPDYYSPSVPPKTTKPARRSKPKKRKPTKPAPKPKPRKPRIAKPAGTAKPKPPKTSKVPKPAKAPKPAKPSTKAKPGKAKRKRQGHPDEAESPAKKAKSPSEDAESTYPGEKATNPQQPAQDANNPISGGAVRGNPADSATNQQQTAEHAKEFIPGDALQESSASQATTSAKKAANAHQPEKEADKAASEEAAQKSPAEKATDAREPADKAKKAISKDVDPKISVGNAAAVHASQKLEDKVRLQSTNDPIDPIIGAAASTTAIAPVTTSGSAAASVSHPGESPTGAPQGLEGASKSAAESIRDLIRAGKASTGEDGKNLAPLRIPSTSPSSFKPTISDYGRRGSTPTPPGTLEQHLASAEAPPAPMTPYPPSSSLHDFQDAQDPYRCLSEETDEQLNASSKATMQSTLTSASSAIGQSSSVTNPAYNGESLLDPRNPVNKPQLSQTQHGMMEKPLQASGDDVGSALDRMLFKSTEKPTAAQSAAREQSSTGGQSASDEERHPNGAKIKYWARVPDNWRELYKNYGRFDDDTVDTDNGPTQFYVDAASQRARWGCDKLQLSFNVTERAQAIAKIGHKFKENYQHLNDSPDHIAAGAIIMCSHAMWEPKSSSEIGGVFEITDREVEVAAGAFSNPRKLGVLGHIVKFKDCDLTLIPKTWRAVWEQALQERAAAKERVEKEMRAGGFALPGLGIYADDQSSTQSDKNAKDNAGQQKSGEELDKDANDSKDSLDDVSDDSLAADLASLDDGLDDVEDDALDDDINAAGDEADDEAGDLAADETAGLPSHDAGHSSAGYDEDYDDVDGQWP